MRASAEAGVPVIGGDTTAADRLVLSVTALGRRSAFPAGPARVPATSWS